MAKYKIEFKKPTTIADVTYKLNLIEATEILNNVFCYCSYDANDVFSAYIKYYKLNMLFISRKKFNAVLEKLVSIHKNNLR